MQTYGHQKTVNRPQRRNGNKSEPSQSEIRGFALHWQAIIAVLISGAARNRRCFDAGGELAG
jgi:hypothetical protein